MPNMSYCRFQNTDIDYRDCASTVLTLIESPEDGEKLSDEERHAARSLITQSLELLEAIAEHFSTSLEEVLSTSRGDPADTLRGLFDRICDEAEDKTGGSR
jgi:hypothetical protein